MTANKKKQYNKNLNISFIYKRINKYKINKNTKHLFTFIETSDNIQAK
jgi:hypothetical protein